MQLAKNDDNDCHERRAREYTRRLRARETTLAARTGLRRKPSDVSMAMPGIQENA